jgi:2-methylisocitrate lyase-like PEP mutase family enzyme
VPEARGHGEGVSGLLTEDLARFEDEMRRVADEVSVPQIANKVFGGLTPPLPQTELANLGFGGVLDANAALALKSVYDVMAKLKRDGSRAACADLTASVTTSCIAWLA